MSSNIKDYPPAPKSHPRQAGTPGRRMERLGIRMVGTEDCGKPIWELVYFRPEELVTNRPKRSVDAVMRQVPPPDACRSRAWVR